jgi:uncharacterized glyoxalase superfamily protein PhnB
MITNTMYVLAVPSLSRSGDFYREVLGFEVRETGDAGWRMFVKDSCRILAGECPDAMAPRDIGDHSYFGYFVVDRVDAYYDRARSKGAEITKPLRDEPWGMREFGVRTADGHRIMIGSHRESSEGGGRPNPAQSAESAT